MHVIAWCCGDARAFHVMILASLFLRYALRHFSREPHRISSCFFPLGEARNFVPSYPQQGSVVSVLSILYLTPLGRSSWSVRLLGSGGCCTNCLVAGVSGVGCPEQVKRCARWTGVYQAGKGAEGLKTVTFCDAFKISVNNFLNRFGPVQPSSPIVHF